MLVQMYGQFGHENSNSIVCRGIACALHRHNIDIQIYDPAGIYRGLWEDIPTGLTPRAEVGLAVGYPPQVWQHLSGHEVKIGCFIAESSLVPSDWGAIVSSCDITCVPSSWVAEAFIRAGANPRKIMVMPHGLHPVYAKACHTSFPPAGKIRFLHVAGAAAFRERKGTLELIAAFGQLVQDRGKGISLRLRCGSLDPDIRNAVLATGVPEAFDIVTDKPLQPAHMRAFYCEGHVALVLPSRAEAFGLCALEARSLGIPVILTKASGHAQHAEAWDTFIHHEVPDTPCRVNGIPGGMAPGVTAVDIYDAMQEFLAHVKSRWDWAQHGTLGYYDRHTWSLATCGLAKKLKGYKKRPSRPGIGL